MEKRIKFFDENLVGQDGLSRYLNPETNWEREIEDYDIAIYTDRMCFIKEVDPSKVNIAWLIEPPIINGENYKYIVEQQNKFNWVFSHHRPLQGRMDNFVWLAHGGTWLRTEDIEMWGKTKNISFIYSYKEWNAGHRFRHNLANHIKDMGVDFYGSGTQTPLDFKIDGLKDYRYSIIMENSQEDDYFTEKLLDCFLTGTIPIYYGTKNIGEYFNREGMFTFETAEQLVDILNSINEETYNHMKHFIPENFKKANDYIHPEKEITTFLKNGVS